MILDLIFLFFIGSQLYSAILSKNIPMVIMNAFLFLLGFIVFIYIIKKDYFGENDTKE